jgi:serine/threonine protein kinase
MLSCAPDFIHWGVPNRARRYRQMLDALVYIHRLRVVHRDLKVGGRVMRGLCSGL